MPQRVKFIAAGIITVFLATAWIFGVYLPIQKSQRYINAYQKAAQVRSVEEFMKLFDSVLDYYSPVGRDEVVSSYLGVILNVLGQKGTPKEVVQIFTQQAERRSQYFIDKKAGFIFSQNLFKLGMVYKMSMDFGFPEMYSKAVDVLELGREASPGRPVFLYNLLELYYGKGDKEKARGLAQQILRYWPNEERVRQLYESLK